MNVNEAIETLLDVASSIFSEAPQQLPNVELNTIKLKESIEGVLHLRRTPLETKMIDPDRPPTRCKVYVSPITVVCQI
jgi:hypothetical protein